MKIETNLSLKTFWCNLILLWESPYEDGWRLRKGPGSAYEGRYFQTRREEMKKSATGVDDEEERNE